MHRTRITAARRPSRFPLSLFALYREPGDDPFMERLDALERQMPDRLPEKRFFRH